jgi:hypothetical protein
MKKTVLMASAFLIAGAAFAPGFAQEEKSAQEEQAQLAIPASEAAKPAEPAKKKPIRKKRAKKAPVKPMVSESEFKTADQAPAKAPALAAEVPQTTQVSAVSSAPVADTAALKPEAPPPSSCPDCFQPLPIGYESIIADLKSWTAELETQAAIFDLTLSAVQKQIDEKDNAIEKARLGTDKKAVKAAVKSLTKERKLFLKEYTAESDKKTEFYKQFAKEAEKKIDYYNKMVEEKLKQAQASALQQ